jgi:hypothetical protein
MIDFNSLKHISNIAFSSIFTMPATITHHPPTKLETESLPFLPSHPYFPLDLELPLYVANEWELVRILACFVIALGTLLAFTIVATKAVNPRLTRRNRATVWWFVLCMLPPL